MTISLSMTLLLQATSCQKDWKVCIYLLFLDFLKIGFAFAQMRTFKDAMFLSTKLISDKKNA